VLHCNSFQRMQNCIGPDSVEGKFVKGIFLGLIYIHPRPWVACILPRSQNKGSVSSMDQCNGLTFAWHIIIIWHIMVNFYWLLVGNMPNTHSELGNWQNVFQPDLMHL
jgi:hypothetical protein